MKQRKDGEEEVEVALKRRRPRIQNNTTTSTNNNGDANMDLKLAKSESSSEEEGEDRGKEESESSEEDEESDENEENEEEEEVIESESERGVENLDSNTMCRHNCSSCITKDILRRRKRVTFNVRHPKPADPLGCLSFLSFFIPRGNGFNLFRIFGYGRKDKNTQISQQDHEPAPTENLPASDTAYEEENMVIEQGNVHGQQVNQSDNAAPDPSRILIKVLSDRSIFPLSLEVTLSLGQTMCINGVVRGPTIEMLQGPELVGTPTFQEPVLPNEKTMTMAALPTKPESEIGECVEAKKSENGKTMTRAALPTKPESEIEECVCVEAKKSEGADATMLEAEQVKAGEFQSTTHIFFMFMAVTVSIVYGGLVESIASLGVVSSAAAADATTLNIVALGLASLIGRLFIIGHNLMEVKNDGPKGTSNERNVEADRNQELLGQREKFLLLATVAVLTFLVFGLIPPVTYGFSFWKSDNRDLKLVAVAAASLLCIAILAFGKAHIRRPPKFYKHFKTLLYYVTNAILVSGVFYMVGDLIKKRMEKFG